MKDESQSSLMGHLLPEPSHPRVKIRVAATATLLLFGCYIAFQALGPSGESSDAGLGWRNYQEVSWGQGKGESLGLAEFGADRTELSEAQETEGWTDESASQSAESDSTSTPSSQTSFPRGTAEQVDRLLQEGSLSSYRWHATLGNLTAAVVDDAEVLGDAEALEEKRWWGSAKVDESTPKGRLIVVGDAHGMVESLTSLLDRISYNSSLDTLLFVGDLVAKSTVNSSLQTVALLRHHGAKGVRGNHDQGVLEFRRWMESYGPLGGSTTATASAGGRKQGWIGSEGEAEVQKRRRGMKRWWWSSSETTEEEAEEEAAADTEGGLSEEQGESVSDGATAETSEEGSMDKEEIMTAPPTSTSAVDELADGSWTGEEALPTPIRGHRPFKGRPSRISHAPSSTSASPSTPTSYGSSGDDSVGSLTGPGWEWLDLSAKEVKKLGVNVPHGWDWGGDWFQIARALPQIDADFIRDLPLTLWIEELRTYIVHAGLLPWSSLSEELEKATTKGSDPLPSLLESTSLRTFSPSPSTSELLDSLERALLLIPQNEDPFTLLNMRTLHEPRKSKGKGTKVQSGLRVSKGQKGTPWTTVWGKSMKECRDTEKCDPVNVVYGHWAGADLTVKTNSIGLDSGCAYGRRLSALVLPKTASSSDFPSPLETGPSPSAQSFTTSKGKQVPDPFAGLSKPSDDRRMVKRAPPPHPARPGDDGPNESTSSLAEVSNEGEDDVAPSGSDDGEEPEDDAFGDRAVELHGRQGWVVSYSCEEERKRIDDRLSS